MPKMQNALLGSMPQKKSRMAHFFDCLEAAFDWLIENLLNVAGIIIGLLLIPISLDILMRPIGGLYGVMDIESMALVLIGFIAIAYSTIKDQHIAIDMFYNLFTPKTKLRIDLFSHIFCIIVCLAMGYYTFMAGLRSSAYTPMLRFNHSIFIFVTSFGLFSIAIASLFKLRKIGKQILQAKDFLGVILVVSIIVLLVALPFLYKFSGIKLSTLIIGCIGFLILFAILFFRVPIGIVMMGIAILGLFILMRTPTAVATAVGLVPFRQASDFIFLALPMFMLMGEMISLAGLSEALFDCAEKWMGKLPGGLACASVGGCAGFGAVCGDSMATVITMSAVAMTPMKAKGYSQALATGSLAAGGTLGILIPPSMGFIFYSMMTQESVGKLFVAGIVPGILLTLIFMLIIMFQVIRNPALAPRGETYSLKVRLASLVQIIPVIGIFIIVVGGIMYGYFTPGEGGAVGTVCALIYALFRKRLTVKSVMEVLRSTASMCAKIFVILVGVFIFGVFLTTSRLPMLLADFIINLEMSRYIVLFIILGIYVMLGCVMNIIPMMMLTLPSIFPTVQALGFDGIWFGVITVIVMEMGMITPPIGMNVFTLSSLYPEIPTVTIFRGVMPFFFGMIACVLLIILFPQIALWLPSLSS